MNLIKLLFMLYNIGSLNLILDHFVGKTCYFTFCRNKFYIKIKQPSQKKKQTNDKCFSFWCFLCANFLQAKNYQHIYKSSKVIYF